MGRLAKASIALVVLGVVVFAVSQLPSWFWHPLGLCAGTPRTTQGCKGYNSWSGIFSDVGEVTLIVGLITGSVAARRFLHTHFECHEETCHKLGVHHVEGTPYRTCWRHHPVLSSHEKGSVPLSHIHEAHARSQGVAANVQDRPLSGC